MAVEITTRGLDELNRRLTTLVPQAARRALNAALMAGGRVVVREAKARVYTVVKKRTGNLKRGIRARVARPLQTQATAAVHVGVRRDAFYGMFIELGSSGHPARPFLRPAFENSIEEVVVTVAKRLRERIEIEAANAL